MKKKIINVSEPRLSNKTKDYVLDCIKTEWISSSGSYLETFEKKWAKFPNKNRQPNEPEAHQKPDFLMGHQQYCW